MSLIYAFKCDGFKCDGCGIVSQRMPADWGHVRGSNQHYCQKPECQAELADMRKMEKACSEFLSVGG